MNPTNIMLVQWGSETDWSTKHKQLECLWWKTDRAANYLSISQFFFSRKNFYLFILSEVALDWLRG
jgi:hypothetical protein